MSIIVDTRPTRELPRVDELQAACPPWCVHHSPPADGEPIAHSGPHRTLTVHANDAEWYSAEVQIHAFQTEGWPPVIFLDGCGDVGMSPAEAIAYANMIIDYARRVGGVR